MLRIILIFLVVFLIARIFVVMGSMPDPGKASGEAPRKKESGKKKGIPKELGEYVDYEEMGKKQ